MSQAHATDDTPSPVTPLLPAAGPEPTFEPDPGHAQGRGFVLYVGLSETRARAAGTSLDRIARALRYQLNALLPQAQAEIRLVTSASPDDVPDLDVVRLARRADHDLQAAYGAAEGVAVDLDRQTLRVDGAVVPISARQFALLARLVEATGSTVSRQRLAAELSNRTDSTAGDASGPRHIDVLVGRLRAHLGPYGAIIRTVRGIGYRFDAHPDVHVLAAGRSTSTLADRAPSRTARRR